MVGFFVVCTGENPALRRGELFTLCVGKTYHLKTHVTPSEIITMTINDNNHRVQQIGPPNNEALPDLWGWPPSSTWLVKNVACTERTEALGGKVGRDDISSPAESNGQHHDSN